MTQGTGPAEFHSIVVVAPWAVEDMNSPPSTVGLHDVETEARPEILFKGTSEALDIKRLS